MYHKVKAHASVLTKYLETVQTTEPKIPKADADAIVADVEATFDAGAPPRTRERTNESGSHVCDRERGPPSATERLETHVGP